MSKLLIKNPREYRILKALLASRAIFRKELNEIAGANNSPQNVKDMRDRCDGLQIPCPRITVLDRDGKTSRPGKYYLTDNDKQIAREAIKKWEEGDTAPTSLEDI